MIATDIADVVPPCQFSVNSQQPSVIYLDLNDTVTFNTTLIGTFASTSVSVASSNSTAMNVKGVSRATLISGQIVNRTVTATVTEMMTNVHSTESVIVTAHAGNARCPAMQQVSQVRIGCIPYRTMQLRTVGFPISSRCSSLQNGGTFEVPTTGEVVYDYEKYGCPLYVRYDTDGFRPIVCKLVANIVLKLTV